MFWQQTLAMGQGVIDGFEACFTTFGQTELPYRKATYQDTEIGDRILAIYLHGGSSKGNDNIKQMQEMGIDSINRFIRESGKAGVFIVPQCPADASWGGKMNKTLKMLIDYTVSTEGIDPSRIYIFGGSMGGTGSWGMVDAYPHLFAAAMPCAANPSACQPKKVAATPVYTVMGTDDNIMKVETAQDFVERLQRLGGDAKIDIEEGWSHERTCIESYTAQRLAWIFSHRRSTETGIVQLHPYNEKNSIRSLSGRKLPCLPASGFCIQNGKKIYIGKQPRP